MAVRLPILDVSKLHARLDELLAKGPRDVAWSEPLILSDDIQAFVIVHPPGTPNDTHYHEHDEWWVVMRGEINWHIEGEAQPIRARAGDFVLCPKFHNHHLEPVGSELTVRIGINTRGEFHRYDRPGCRPTPWRTETDTATQS
jgi:mannose-6-phosphate isomerase-like protein (cupin superfamily)